MVCVTRSGGSNRRSCLGCPGWPPRRRPEGVAGGWGGAAPGPSEEGGREEFDELAARRAWSSCTSDSKTCTRARSLETASFSSAFSRSSSAIRRSFGSTASIDPLGSSRRECQSRFPVGERLRCEFGSKSCERDHFSCEIGSARGEGSSFPGEQDAVVCGLVNVFWEIDFVCCERSSPDVLWPVQLSRGEEGLALAGVHLSMNPGSECRGILVMPSAAKGLNRDDAVQPPVDTNSHE